MQSGLAAKKRQNTKKMSLGKIGRKLKRVGKGAVQFRFTSTLEYIDLQLKGTWRPDKLRVIWLRNHRRVESINIQWVPTEDRGPNGADGRATFDPPLAISLIVTLYRNATSDSAFEEKEYKYYIENVGPSGKKILASFNCDMAEYAGIPSERHTLDMTFKAVSKKVDKALLGITLESEFMKQGTSNDEDMQSTFSAMSAGNESLQFDEDDEDDTTVVTAEGRPHQLSIVEEKDEEESGNHSLVTLGTGEKLRRGTLPRVAPPKPTRSPSFRPKNVNLGTDNDASNTEATNSELTAQSANIATITSTIPTATTSDEKTEEESQQESNTATANAAAEAEITNSVRTRPVNTTVVSDQKPAPDESPTASSNVEGGGAPAVEKENKSSFASNGIEEAKSEPVKEQPQEEPITVVSANNTPPSKDAQVKPSAATSDDKKPLSKPAVSNAASNAVEHQVTGATTQVSTKSDASQSDSPSGRSEVKSILKNGSRKGEGSAESKTNKTDNGDSVIPKTSLDVSGYSIRPISPESMSAVQVTPHETTPTAPVTTPTTNGVDTTVIEESVQEEEVKAKPVQEVLTNGHMDEIETKEEEDVNGYIDDPIFETARMLADVEKRRSENSLKQTERRTSGTTASKPRRAVESNEAYHPPPNPYLAEQEINGDAKVEDVPPSPTVSWLGEEATFVNCFGETVDREKLDRAKIIGLYFSASWCPPCRTFLPKLIKFYHHLKQHGKSFEILHISSDYSKQDMMKYMLDQQMPWVGLSYDCKAGEKLKKQFKVSAIPLLTIVSTKGSKLEDSAKKQVQSSSSGATILKLYNQWYDKLDPEEKGDTVEERSVSEVVESKEKKGLLKKVKSHFTGKEKNKEMGDNEPDSPGLRRSQSKEDSLNESIRHTVEEKPRTKRSKSHVTAEMMEEKEETIRHLEEVNRTLKQTNDDLNEDVAELRRQLQETLMKLADLESTSQQLQDEKRELMANLNIRGWLFKRGIKGLTGSVWRRRYFRCDQGSKIYYYKSASEGTPQGHIDLDKIISVQEVSSAQQDKNHASFLVQCDGRTYQLQAMDEANMRKWIGAINYLREYRRRSAQALEEQAAATPH